MEGLFGALLLASFTSAFTSACGGGVFVEVDTTDLPRPVGHVELVAAKHECVLPFDRGFECNRIRGEGFTEAFPGKGNMFLRLANAETTVDADGLAAFELPGGVGVLPIVFAIARDEQGAVGAAVMENTIDTSDGAVVYRITLDPVEDLLRNSRSAGHAGFREWGVDTGRDCIGIAPAQPDPDRGAVFIVPEDNPDCDSLKDEGECEPLAFNGIKIDERSSDRHCAIRSERVPPANNMERPCVVGHLPICSDIPLDGEPCTEIEESTPICLPSQLCSGLLCDPNDHACLEETLRGTALFPPPSARIDCPTPATLDAGLVLPCLENRMVLLRPEGIPPATTCSEVFLTGDESPFHSDGAQSFESGGATFSIVDSDAQCNVKFEWSGMTEGVRSATTTIVFTVDTATATRKLMFPIKFQQQQACLAVGEEAACQVFPPPGAPDAPDSITACAF